MPVTVEAEGLGTVEFPDDATDEEIIGALPKLHEQVQRHDQIQSTLRDQMRQEQVNQVPGQMIESGIGGLQDATGLAGTTARRLLTSPLRAAHAVETTLGITHQPYQDIFEPSPQYATPTTMGIGPNDRPLISGDLITPPPQGQNEMAKQMMGATQGGLDVAGGIVADPALAPLVGAAAIPEAASPLVMKILESLISGQMTGEIPESYSQFGKKYEENRQSKLRGEPSDTAGVIRSGVNALGTTAFAGAPMIHGGLKTAREGKEAPIETQKAAPEVSKPVEPIDIHPLVGAMGTTSRQIGIKGVVHQVPTVILSIKEGISERTGQKTVTVELDNGVSGTLNYGVNKFGDIKSRDDAINDILRKLKFKKGENKTEAPAPKADQPVEPLQEAGPVVPQAQTESGPPQSARLELREGDKRVTIQKPDGSTYEAALGPKFYEDADGNKIPSIANETPKGWSHGPLPEGDKIVEANSESNTTTPFSETVYRGTSSREIQSKPEEAMAGPGGTVPSDIGGEKSEISQLADSISGLKKTREPSTPSNRLTEIKDSVASGLQKAKNAFKASVDYIRNPPKFDSIDKAVGRWSRERQESGRDAYFAWKKAEKDADLSTREAIGAYVDVGGDRAKMKEAADTLPERYAKTYRRALDLNPNEIKAAENVRNYFDKRLEDAQKAGVLEDGIENYIRRIYEEEPAKRYAKLSEFAHLSTSRPNFAKLRSFLSDIDSIKAGLKPVQDFAQRAIVYDQELNRAIADRGLVRSLMDQKMPDGRPMIDIAGRGIPIEGEGGTETTLIKPQFKPNSESPKDNRTDYKAYNHPAFRKWKWVTEDSGGKPVMVQGDVLIHPEAYKRIRKLLDKSSIRETPVARELLAASSIQKQTMLDLSGFHQTQIGVHAAEHRVNGFNTVEVNLKDPTQKALVEHGLTVFEEKGMADFSEGLHGNSLISKIPKIGSFANAYHNWLFKEWIPQVKITMALHALERNKARFPKLSEDQLLKMTADQANAAFGGQNWKMLGYSETQVDLLRMAFLAPDFLLSRAKFVGQAGKSLLNNPTKLGGEQGQALLLGAAALWVTARIANQMISGNPHMEKDSLFSIVYNGKSYSLRTVQGDILHLLEHPGQFWYHRVNPLIVKPLIELVTGRNYFGRKVTPLEVAKETILQTAPISLHGAIDSKDASLFDSALNAFGVVTKRFSAVSTAYQLANDWKEKNHIKEAPGEFIYDPAKDPLSDLKTALQYEDTAKAAIEVKKLLDSKTYSRLKLNDYFRKYATSPFTGSDKNEIKFLKGLNPADKATINDARKQRMDIRRSYQTARDAVPPSSPLVGHPK